jgi:hypothetical protein
VPGAQLMESMRAVGYSTQTALADIVDNSITAKASTIDILVRSDGEDPYIAILDDGIGMNGDAIRHAMQLAGTYSESDRESDDLGRFGLGLKTASLSQCRRLTLISKVDGVLSAVSWDLGHIAATNEWSLLVLDPAEIERLPGYSKLEVLQHGTLVVWSDLDRFPKTANRAALIDQAVADTMDHLSLVFHRFLDGESGLRKIRLNVNGNELSAADPFLTGARGVQPSRRETLIVDGREIAVQAFTLPYLGKMSASDRRKASVAGGIRESQGFYVYRGSRLVIWGTWFRLMPKSDLGKLTRVKVDIPNSLDHLWSLDIKKSSAVPPSVVRDRLRTLASSMSEPSRRVHTYRGRREPQNDPISRTWNVIADRDTFRYEINREHPALLALTNNMESGALRDLETTLKVIETTFPVQDLHNRMSGDAVPEPLPDNLHVLRVLVVRAWSTNPDATETREAFVDRMLTVEPFDALAAERAEILGSIEHETRGEL